MEIIIQFVLLLVLAGTALAAFRQYRRVRLNPYSRSLQRATLALCAEVMSNEKNTAKARNFARQIALFTMSDKVLLGLAKDHAGLTKNIEGFRNSESADHDTGLSDADKKVVQPLLHVFAMTCLLHDPKYSPQVRKLWEEATARAYARANTVGGTKTNGANASPAAEPSSKPVEEKLHRVEDQILERLNGLCAA